MFNPIVRPRIGGFVMSVRTHKRKSVNALTQIQLLQDVKGVGYKGEILKVKPGFMRNFLHVGNKACYINGKNPPRIPIVEKEDIMEVKRRERDLLAQQEVGEVEQDLQEEEPKATLSLEELSDLFSNLKTKGSSKQFNFNIQQDLVPNQEDLLTNDENEIVHQNLQSNELHKIPKIITISHLSLPIGKVDLVKSINKHQDGLIESGDDLKITFIDTPNEFLENIEEKGRYQIKFTYKNEPVQTMIEIE